MNRHTLECLVLHSGIKYSEYTSIVCDLDRDTFSSSMTRSIHNAMQCVYTCGQKIDNAAIAAEMVRLGQPEQYMDDLIIEQATGEYVFSQNIPRLIYSLKDLAYREDCLVGFGNKILQMVCDGTETKEIISEIEHIHGIYSAPNRFFEISNTENVDDLFVRDYGISTGIKGIDDRLHGIYGSDLIILAARPGVGKSTLALNIAEHIIEKEKRPVIMFSREMSKRQICARIYSKKTGISYHDIIRNKMMDYEYSKLKETHLNMISTWKNMFPFDDYTSDIDDILANAKQVKCEIKPGLMIVDYIGLCNTRGINANERMSIITRKLKQFSQETGIPILALSQLNRESSKENRAPALSDLRDSGSIEQDANAVIFLYYDKEKTHFFGNVAKNRSGETGEFELHFDKPSYTISDYKYNYMHGVNPNEFHE